MRLYSSHDGATLRKLTCIIHNIVALTIKCTSFDIPVDICGETANIGYCRLAADVRACRRCSVAVVVDWRCRPDVE